MKVVLLDKRYGESREDIPEKFKVVRGGTWDDHIHMGNGNTFALVETFENIMTGPFNSETDYTPLQDYDLVYIRARFQNEVEAIKNLRETCPKPIIMAYTDEWVNMQRFDSDSWISKLSKHADAVICGFGEKYEKEAFRQMGVDNYYHCPYGSDVYNWSQWFKPINEREFAVAGMWHIRSFKEQGLGDRVHSRTLFSLKKLQDEFGVKCYFFLNFDGWHVEDRILDFATKIGLNVTTLKHMPNVKFNEKMASLRLFIEEYPCPAYSRATVLSAALGTPSVSTDMNEPSLGCFPDLTVEFGDWDKWDQLSSRLMRDDEFWLKQQKAGVENCQYYYYPTLKERILTLYEKLLSNR